MSGSQISLIPFLNIIWYEDCQTDVVTRDRLQGKHRHGLISIKQILSAVSHCECQPGTCAPLWPALFRHLTYVHTSLHFTLTDRQECTARIIMCSYKYELNINNNRDLYCSNCSMWSKIISFISLSLFCRYIYMVMLILGTQLIR